MVSACLDYHSGRVVPKAFFTSIETSEKAALSFIAGCLGTHLAARRWLDAAGRKMVSFLHAGIFTKATVVLPSSLLALNKTSKRLPDYLVCDSAGEWHVFESKGGTVGSRWPQIVDGLRQLEGITGVGLASLLSGPGSVAALPAPTTKVCVQTLLEAGRDVSVTVVDPPGNTRAPSEPKASDTPNLELNLIPGVADLLLFLESIDWFYGLSEGPLPADDTRFSIQNWIFNRSSAFGGLVIGIPLVFAKIEERIREKMSLYLAVQEVLENLSSSHIASAREGLPSPPRDQFIEALSQHPMIARFAVENQNSTRYSPESIYEEISQLLGRNKNRPVGSLHAWALSLGLNEEANLLHDGSAAAGQDVLFLKLLQEGPEAERTFVTGTGMYIQVSEPPSGQDADDMTTFTMPRG